jgi:ribosome-binding protein aMBF1 (putative translation factor)
MNFGDERNRKLWEALTPEHRAAVEAGIERRRAERQTPEYQEQLARDIEAIRREFPPRKADGELAAVLAAFRAERERQGLSLTDVQERAHLERSMVSKLERGEIPNPTVGTLRAFAAALGKRLTLGLAEAEG